MYKGACQLSLVKLETSAMSSIGIYLFLFIVDRCISHTPVAWKHIPLDK